MIQSDKPLAGLTLSIALVAICGTLAVGRAQAPQALSAEAEFMAENREAMDKMMKGMTVKPTGDVDRDFVAMMVPHHQGAIDMAEALLRHGHNPTLKRLAQEIIVTQQQEIAAMRLAVGEPLPPSRPSPTQVDHSTMPPGAMPMTHN